MKSEVLFGNFLGEQLRELGEPFGNLIGTHRKDEGNKGKKSKKKKLRPLVSPS
jgi:DUF1365 family protein